MRDISKLTLIGYETCPFVHRVLIVLNKFKLPFDYQCIDIYNKPTWFIELSPTGKVPVLLHNKRVIFESDIINEYLCELTQQALLPHEPLEKACYRSWSYFCGQLISQHHIMLKADTLELFTQHCEQLLKQLAILETKTSPSNYFDGKNFSIVDAAYLPLFAKISIVETIYPVNIFSDAPKLTQWSTYLLASEHAAALPANLKILLRNKIKGFNSFLSPYCENE